MLSGCDRGQRSRSRVDQAHGLCTAAWPLRHPRRWTNCRPLATDQRQVAFGTGLLEPKTQSDEGSRRRHAFWDLAPQAATNAMYNALSSARSTLSALGHGAADILATDRTSIYISPTRPHRRRPRTAMRKLSMTALRMTPGRHAIAVALVEALSVEGVLLEDDLYAEWSASRRQGLELARQDARLALARGRSLGLGRSGGKRRHRGLGGRIYPRPGFRRSSHGLDDGVRGRGPPPAGGPHLRPLPSRFGRARPGTLGRPRAGPRERRSIEVDGPGAVARRLISAGSRATSQPP